MDGGTVDPEKHFVKFESSNASEVIQNGVVFITLLKT